MVHISGCDSGACVCYASFECVGMCKYDDVNVLFYFVCSMHAGLLGGRYLGRRCRVSLQQLGAFCGGCVSTKKKIVSCTFFPFLFTAMQVYKS